MASTPYSTTVQAPTDVSFISVNIPVFAASALANADEITDLVLGLNYQLIKVDFVCVTPITTAAKTCTLTPYIDAVAVPGTVTALAGTKAKGVVSNIFTADLTKPPVYGSIISKFKLTGSGTTAFVEGAGYFVCLFRVVGNLS
jgi:hypothetical protein